MQVSKRLFVSPFVKTSDSEGVLYISPEIGIIFLRIPKGKFEMGATNDELHTLREMEQDAKMEWLSDHRKSYKEIEIGEYWISKYPITVEQFEVFAHNSNYNTDAESEGYGGKRTQGGRRLVTGADWRHPGGSRISVVDKKDHPVTQVSHRDATAFQRWVSQITGESVRLPTEAEWEKAARGERGNIFPWGEDKPDNTRCNFDMNVGSTTPVGTYSPRGDSPYGVADAAGNVWEWTREGVIKGGSFLSPTRYVCCAAYDEYRDDENIWDWDEDTGIRLVIEFPRESPGPAKEKHSMQYASAFLSHSSEDKLLVENVARELSRRGVCSWLDKNALIAGASLSEEFRRVIPQQTTLVVFLSPDALLSDWVTTELSIALAEWENTLEGSARIIPVYLGDPLRLVQNHSLLSQRWLREGQVDKFGISSADPKEIAEKIAKRIYVALNIRSASEVLIYLDQRGADSRHGVLTADDLGDLHNSTAPILVIRPDLKDRSDHETLAGDEWDNLRHVIRWTLSTALGTPKWVEPKAIRIVGYSQLALPYILGAYFNRNTSADLFCTDVSRKQTFDNKGQRRDAPLEGGNAYCETEMNIPETASELETLALILAQNPKVVQQAKKSASDKHAPYVWVKNENFHDNDQVQRYISDIVALLSRLSSSYCVRTVNLYCGLPFHVIPLLAANLLNVIDNVVFMEYRKDLQGKQTLEEMYVPLQTSLD